MAVLTIRNLDESIKGRLRVRAAARGRSMEEEVRQILRAAVNESPAVPGDFAERIRHRFAKLGDVALPIGPREPVREPAVPADAPKPSRKAAAPKTAAAKAGRRR